jgi:hypothetical protein
VKDREIRKYLLEHTRHTPRDIIQLLNEIQKHSKDNPSKANIANAVRTYSTDYFVGEVRDELDGFLKSEEIDLMIEIISLIGRSRFNMDHIDRIKNTDLRFKSVDVNKCLKAFFNCNAIGNVDGSYITFKYRNRHTTFNPNSDILVHVGLRKGWNLT